MALETLEPNHVRSPRIRDSQGLMPQQLHVLSSLALNPDWKAACAEADVEIGRLRHWLRHDDAFRAAYNKLMVGALEETKAKLSSLLPRVSNVFEDALDATSTLDVDCPECGHSFGVGVPAWAIRKWAAEALLKQHGQLATRVEVSGEVQHPVLTLEEYLALALLRRGGEVPPGVLAALRERGLLESEEPPVEAEYTPVENTSDESS